MIAVFVYEHLCALAADAAGRRGPASSLLREGRAMLGAVCADLRSIPGVKVTTAGSSAESEFRRLAAAADFSLVVAPETAGILESRCRWALESNSSLLGPSPTAVHLTADKLELCRHLERCGVPTPRTWPLAEEPGLFPIVWKPRDGAGSQSTFLLKTPADRERILPVLERPAGMIAQEFAEGLPASVAFLLGPRQRVQLQPCYQFLSNDGRFQYLGGRTPIPAGLAERAVSLATAAVAAIDGMFGYAGVDLILGSDESADRIIEINPRLTTSYIGLRQLADFNIAEMLLRIVRNESLPSLRWRPGSVDFTPETAGAPGNAVNDYFDREPGVYEI